MASPTVWTEARAIITAAAAAAPLDGMLVAWPNEYTQEPEPNEFGEMPVWASVEIEADAASPYEVGGGLWHETGHVLIHVFSAVGTGIEAGLSVRKTFADAFRGRPPGALLWDDFVFPAGDQPEGGNWFHQILSVSYRYTDA